MGHFGRQRIILQGNQRRLALFLEGETEVLVTLGATKTLVIVFVSCP